MDTNIISSFEQFTSKDFFFDPRNAYVYSIDLDGDFVSLFFVYFGNFSFYAKNNIRYSLQTKYKGAFRCKSVKKYKKISGCDYSFNRNAEKFELTQQDIKQQEFNISKNFWNSITVDIHNPTVGRTQIVCKSISYQSFEQFNREEILQQIDKINSLEIGEKHQNNSIIKNDIDKSVVELEEENGSHRSNLSDTEERNVSLKMIASKLNCDTTIAKERYFQQMDEMAPTLDDLRNLRKHLLIKSNQESKQLDLKILNTPSAIYYQWTIEFEKRNLDSIHDNTQHQKLINAIQEDNKQEIERILRENPKYLDDFLSIIADEE